MGGPCAGMGPAGVFQFLAPTSPTSALFPHPQSPFSLEGTFCIYYPIPSRGNGLQELVLDADLGSHICWKNKLSILIVNHNNLMVKPACSEVGRGEQGSSEVGMALSFWGMSWSEWGGDDGSADEVLGMGKERGLICKGNEIITCSVCCPHSTEPDELCGEGAGGGGHESTLGWGLCRSKASHRWGSCSPPRGLG